MHRGVGRQVVDGGQAGLLHRAGAGHDRGRLQALDATAVSLAMDNEMPIVVFDMTVPGNIARAIRGEPIGTLISGDESR